MYCFALDTIQHTKHLPVPKEAVTGLCSIVNRSNFAVDMDRRHKLHNLFGNADHSAYWAPTCSRRCCYWVVQHYQLQLCCGQKTQTARCVWQCRSFSILSTYLFPGDAGTELCSTINRSNFAGDGGHKLHHLFGNADHSAYWAPTRFGECRQHQGTALTQSTAAVL